LLNQVLVFDVPGDVVEIGAHAGVTATLLMTVLNEIAPDRKLHLFDVFLDPTEAAVIGNFKRLGLSIPEFRRGWLHDTLRKQLPDQVAFFQIDLAPGRSPELLGEDIRTALEAIYPRMTPGSIGVVQDYCDPTAYERPGWHFPRLITSTKNWNQYPQVKRACDDFFAGKPERMYPLYAGSYSHGYFRKQARRQPPEEP
jgi:O-methyltransferase